MRPPRQSQATDGAVTDKAGVTGHPEGSSFGYRTGDRDWDTVRVPDSRVELTGEESPSAPVRQVLSAFSGIVELPAPRRRIFYAEVAERMVGAGTKLCHLRPPPAASGAGVPRYRY